MADAKGSYIGGAPVLFKDVAARAMISDEYSPAKAYTKGGLCIRNGKIYKAIKETTGDWDATAWEETSLTQIQAENAQAISALNASKINLVNYNARTNLAVGSQNIIGREFTFTKNGCVVAFTRTQQTDGTGFIRINSPNGLTLYEANGLKGKYTYLWSPPIYVGANTSLIITAEINPSVTDGQIGVAFYS